MNDNGINIKIHHNSNVETNDHIEELHNLNNDFRNVVKGSEMKWLNILHIIKSKKLKGCAKA